MFNRSAALLGAVCLFMTGCLSYPITTTTGDASAVSSDYPVTDIGLSGDVLSVHLNDPSTKDVDSKRIKFLSALLTSDGGRKIDLKLLSTSYANGITLLFNLHPQNGHFDLRVSTSVGDQEKTITAKLWIHDVGKLISWHDLDHG